ncbi:MAG: cytochrome c biogenesis protein CcsA [Proteobacteria bacterium]|nr:cytochrome c biogenesis protein CcsA [Pseudomonadota bacterium]
MITAEDRRELYLGAILLAMVVGHWLAAFYYAPVDEHQGEVYRIMFLHVPSAITAFASSAALAVFSVLGLKQRSEGSLALAKATAEVGLLFTVLTLATGSIWGRPTWGTWWTWDARLTTTFLLALLYCGYLLLYAAMPAGPSRIRACAVLGILIFADVPIIYKSVTWWRTLHQPPSMLRAGGSTMEPEILWTLVLGMVILCLYGAWLIRFRSRNIRLADTLEAASFDQLQT